MTTFTSNRKERLRLDGQAALSRARALADTAKSFGSGSIGSRGLRDLLVSQQDQTGWQEAAF